MIMMHVGFCQTVSLPDANLRNKLLQSYPQVMQGNNLDIAKAAAHTGTLDLRNSNISNASRIEHFTSITTLNLSFNQLTTIPSIEGTTNLVNFYANNNRLTSLPDMSALTLLRDFQVMNNELSALPDLSGATGLWYLYCTNNNITTLPALTQYPLLKNLVIGENPLNGPIDFSSCTDLVELHIHKTGADTIIGLDKLKKLTTLFAWGNSIRDISGLDSNTTLTICYAYENQIKELPYISNKPGLVTFNIANCDLTYEDIISVLQQDPPATFIYTPQHPVYFQDVTARAETALSLSYPVDTPLSSNMYVWVKNGVVLDSSSSPVLNFDPLNFSDTGNYVLKIYNTNIPNLQLKTNTFRLIVQPCMEFFVPPASIVSKECGKGYTIDLSNAQLSGGTAPFRYEYSNGVFKGKSNEATIESLPEGKYSIKIIDSKNCTATGDFVLDRIEKCDPVITPDGDGIADSYFIDKSGKVKIYDLKRRLVKTLNAPVVWDATDQNGALLDAGYYIITMDGHSPVYITIIR